MPNVNANVFCPHCGREFDYIIDHQELPIMTSGSVSGYLPSINDESTSESERENVYRRNLICPYCSQRFSIDSH